MIDKTKGQKALSYFKGLKYCKNKNTSRVVCYPIIGRSHQLGVHLRDGLGFGIVGDEIYPHHAFNNDEDDCSLKIFRNNANEMEVYK